MAVFDAPDREGMALLAPTVGLGLAPDPADPAVRIRRIRADIETAGPDPGARSPARPQKRPK